MWPVWTAEEARAADRTVQESGLPFAGLLGVAGLQLARFVRACAPPGRIVVLTGPGANGGDGWAAARHLAADFPVTVMPVVEPRFTEAAGWIGAARRAGVEVAGDSLALERLDQAVLVVDAIFGTGFHGAVTQSPAGPWLERLSELQLPVVAADIPSGVDSNTGGYDGPRLNMAATVAMGAAKWGLISYPGADHTGSLAIADIGLPGQGFAHPYGRFIDPAWAREHFPVTGKLAHKYNRGHVLVIGGSRQMPGAPILAATAALNAGAGLVEVAVPEDAARSGAAFSPALIMRPVDQTADGSLKWSQALRQWAGRADAIVFGPGIGTAVDPRVLAELSKLNKPTVVDADGLRLAKGLSMPLPPNWVLTPHAGELGLLLDTAADRVNADRRQAVLDAWQRYGCPVLLKGRYTLIADGEKIWVNPTGNASLATPGSGDVLSGVTARLLAAGLDGSDALALAAYWHGWAGELGSHAHGTAFTATDLVAALEAGAEAIWDEKAVRSLTHWR